MFIGKFCRLYLLFIKNVSSSTSHKKLRLYVREFNFIYESILIKIYMNTNIMNTQIFQLNKYDLKGHWSHKTSSNFNVNPTLRLLDGPLMLPSPNYVNLSHSPSRSLFHSLSLNLSLYASLPPSFAPCKH